MTNAPNNPKDGVTVLHPGTARARCATDSGPKHKITPAGEILDMTLEILGVDELPLTERQPVSGGNVFNGPNTFKRSPWLNESTPLFVQLQRRLGPRSLCSGR